MIPGIGKYLQKLHNSLYYLKKKFPLLKRVTIEITRQCNLQCKHCYMDATLEKDINELTTQELYKIADDLILWENTWIEIIFTGWEPLARKDIRDILKYYTTLWFRCFLVTNGTLLTIERFREIEPYIFWFSVSLDGFEEFHDEFRGWQSFDRIIKNLQAILPITNKDIYLKTVFSKQNIDNLERFYDFIIWIGIKKWHIIWLSQRWRGENLETTLDKNDHKKIREFIQSKNIIELIYDDPLNIENKKCSCGIEEYAILYNGDIIACLNTDRKKVRKYWNIRNNSIDCTWNDSFKEYRTKDFYHCKD